ncbi:MAG: OmpA family protein [Deltaproteobacteria bacterium]|nr:OmpA family protein [Deltaproteobacteria bacterium]MDQ3298964.1 OmpA family protein [Myxococcota bacterium]
MHRVRHVASALIAMVLGTLGVTPAQADDTQLGAWVGPRTYSSDALLGYRPDAPFHPALANSIAFGARVARPFFPWLVPELELAMSPTRSNAVGGADSVSVFWLDPRLHLRFELMPDRRLQPFIVVGGGAPIALSSARQTFDSGIVGEGYAGGGVRWDTHQGFALRFDARVSIVPGKRWTSIDESGSYIVAELEIGLGVELQLGKRRARKATAEGALADRDADGIGDDKDACPDRAEDADGFDDLDGCPDIDNDADGVLDIADRCATVPEGYNGFQDDDGCPDTVPADVDALRGTIEGLLYAEGETVVRDSAQPNIQRIAKMMTAHPSIRVVLIGHTDDREAKQFATPVDGQPAPDVTELALDLSRARAEAVKQALTAAGVAEGRVIVEGRGPEEPVTDNDKGKGRLANRRVEIKLYVPPR